MTEQEIQEHTEGVDLGAFAPGGELHIADPRDPAIVTKMCGIFKKIRPYLTLVTWIPFVGQKVKDVITAATYELDKVCPGS